MDFLKLIHSPEWSQWIDFLRERRSWLQTRANQALRDCEPERATIYLALMDECLAQIEAFKMRGDVLKRDVESIKEK